MIPQGYPMYVEINDDGSTWPAIVIGWVEGDGYTRTYDPVITAIGADQGVAWPVTAADTMTWRTITEAEARDMAEREQAEHAEAMGD